jgi:antitoxin component of MazEF toxin-antitoxin module
MDYKPITLKVKVRDNGGSMAVSIPPRLANEIGIERGDFMEIQIVDNKIIYSPV